VSIVLSILVIPLVYSLFQILYIVKNRNLQIYDDILNFLNPEKKVKAGLFSELGFVFKLFIITWLIFFVGTVTSAQIFWKQ